MHGLKKSCPISFTLVNVESITSTITVVNAANTISSPTDCTFA